MAETPLTSVTDESGFFFIDFLNKLSEDIDTSPTDPPNLHRRFTQPKTIHKILSIKLHEIKPKELETNIHKEQACFRPRRSCVDHINVMRIIVEHEQATVFKTPVYLLFVDFKPLAALTASKCGMLEDLKEFRR